MKRSTIVIIVVIAFLILGYIGGKRYADSRVEQTKKYTASTEEKDYKPSYPDYKNYDTKTTQQKDNDKAEYEVGEGKVYTYTNSIGDAKIRVAVPIKNTVKTNLYIDDASIDIEYSDGTLADTLKRVDANPQVLKPGETAYYFTVSDFDGDSTEGLKVITHADIKMAEVDCIRFATSEATLKEGKYFGVEITGRVENTSYKKDSYVFIVADLFDENGDMIGRTSTVLTEDLQPGEKIGFKMTSSDTNLNVEKVSSYSIYAYPYQYQF